MPLSSFYNTLQQRHTKMSSIQQLSYHFWRFVSGTHIKSLWGKALFHHRESAAWNSPRSVLACFILIKRNAWRGWISNPIPCAPKWLFGKCFCHLNARSQKVMFAAEEKKPLESDRSLLPLLPVRWNKLNLSSFGGLLEL